MDRLVDPVQQSPCPFARPWESSCSWHGASSTEGASVAAHAAAVQTLKSLQNRLLLFAGDSLDGQLFVAVACALFRATPASKRHDHVFDADWLPMHSARTLKKRCPSVPSEVGTKSGQQEKWRCHYDQACVTLGRARVCVCASLPLESCLRLHNFSAARGHILVHGTRAVHLQGAVGVVNNGTLDAALAAKLACAER